MKTESLTLTRIGKSQAVRLPADLIRLHGFAKGFILEDRGYEIVLRPKDAPPKLSWEEIYQEMAAAGEDWSAWEGTAADGLDASSNARPRSTPASKTRRSTR